MNKKETFYKEIEEYTSILKNIDEQYNLTPNLVYHSRHKLQLCIHLLESFTQYHNIHIIYLFLDSYSKPGTNCINITFNTSDVVSKENWDSYLNVTKILTPISRNVLLMNQLIQEYKNNGNSSSKAILTRPDNLDSEDFLMQFEILLGKKNYTQIQSILLENNLSKKDNNVKEYKIKI